MITHVTLRKRGSFNNSPASRRARRDFNTSWVGKDLGHVLRAVAYELEIAATKRVDLLAAARYAEQQEATHG